MHRVYYRRPHVSAWIGSGSSSELGLFDDAGAVGEGDSLFAVDGRLVDSAI
jgi:hypothetical protein